MKKNIHPDYQDVLFVDSSTGFKFVCGSTLKPKNTEAFEGKDYPVYKMAVSSASHPFFTGSKKFIDTEGRVEKFRKRYAQKKQDAEQQEEKDKERKAAEKETSKKTRKTKTTKTPITKK